MINEIQPQSELDGLAKQLGDLLVVTESRRAPQAARELGPLSSTASGNVCPVLQRHLYG